MKASSVLQCLSSKLFARCNDTVCAETNSESFYSSIFCGDFLVVLIFHCQSNNLSVICEKLSSWTEKHFVHVAGNVTAM